MELLQRDVSRVRTQILEKLGAITDAVRDDDFYSAVDAEVGYDELVERWADLSDEIAYRQGYPFLVDSPELRDKLMASGRETYDETVVRHCDA